jgi:diketogulonate reductase-like aldo/keto reductase
MKYNIMEFVELGKTGEKIPVLGMGTWKLGAERQEGIKALRTGIKLGSKFIDTAEMYATEDMVGEAIKGEKGMFIATKVSPHNFRYNDVIKACERSLKALGMKTIDLYQLHWPNKSVGIGETMGAMEKLVEDGKIRYIGVSNFSLAELKEAQEAMKRNEIVSNQVEYSVMVRKPERELSDYCRGERITIIAYSPLGQGSLYSPRYRGIYEELTAIAAGYRKTASQAALNWLISKGNLSAIPKAGRSEHVRENMGALGWHLRESDIEKINSFFGVTGDELSSRLSTFLIKRSSGLWSSRLTEHYKKAGRKAKPQK